MYVNIKNAELTYYDVVSVYFQVRKQQGAKEEKHLLSSWHD